MGNGTAAVLEPTFTGYVATTHDALILFEACLTGVLHHVPRRPHDRERSHLVRSGCVFIYEENSSGIKRWTDGVTWSPSRILGNFLVYRELEKPFPPGEKKRAMKKTTRRPVSSTITRPGEPYPRPESNGSASGYSPTSSTASVPFGDRSQQSEMERALVGSLVDSYGFKDSGLVKKTMSVTVAGVTHHLVSYYSVDDVMRGVLTPPSMVESLRYIRPRAELTQKQSFRAPIDDLETGVENPDAMYGYRPQQMMGAPAASAYTMPSPHPEYFMHPSPYSASHPPPSGPTISGYSIGQPLPHHHQPGPGTYLPAPPGSHLGAKSDDYSQYRPSNHYATAYDSLSQSSSMPSTLNTSSLASSHSDRHRSSQSDNSPTAYRNSSISSRSVATDATSPMDPATPGTYSRGSFSIGGALDGSGPTGPGGSQALEHRGLTAFDPLGKRDPNPFPAASYYAGPPPDRHSYYVGGAGAAAGAGGGPGGAHPGYPGTQPLSSWTTTAPSQPQV